MHTSTKALFVATILAASGAIAQENSTQHNTTSTSASTNSTSTGMKPNATSTGTQSGANATHTTNGTTPTKAPAGAMGLRVAEFGGVAIALVGVLAGASLAL